MTGKHGTPEERFWRHVDATGDCWEWTASTTPEGYGQFFPSRDVSAKAHRFAWELLVGPIPQGLVIDHLCRNRTCVNPDHLRVVTHRVNLLAGQGISARHARRTHCKHGHRLEGDNISDRRPWRACVTCEKARQAARIARRSAARALPRQARGAK